MHSAGNGRADDYRCRLHNRSLQAERAPPEFFNLYSQSVDYISTVAKECTGTTRNRINRSNLALTPIPVPPLAEQQRIVGLLDEAFAGIATAKANAEKNLQNARALFESHLQSVFTQRGEGWVEKRSETSPESTTVTRNPLPLKTSARISAPHHRHPDDELIGRPFPIARLIPATCRNASSPMATTSSLEPVQPLARATLSRIHLTLCLRHTWIRVQLKEKELLPQFVNLFFQSIQGHDSRRCVGQRGKRLQCKQARRSPIPFPKSPKEQKTIVDRLDVFAEETQRLATLYERKLAALEALKKSLLHQAFTGEL